MVEIYKKSMTKKVIDKMAIVKEQIIKEMLCRTGKNINVNIVNAKEIIDQVDKHTDIEKGGCVEVIDLLNGDFVTIELEVKEK